MTAAENPDTRARILAVALKEFAAHGYHATSVRGIAERVDVTKAAVLYHFPSKADILGALIEPMLDDLDAALAPTGPPDPTAARWAAIEGLLDVWLRHRDLLRMSLYDAAPGLSGPGFTRFRDGMLRANVLVAGPHPDFVARVRAAQTIAMLSDPVILLADAPPEDLRACILAGVHRLLDGPEPPAAAGPGRGGAERRGRPSAMSPAMVDTARRLHAAGRTAEQIAAELGVSRATVYRHLPT
ncbi:TetR family transcriptional regulator [Kitasatospora sp. NPDC127121]|uniref:TetR family transcriptional regulator n=1 Tax=unclassified Kitasatospora TaxID=2633591 RepID=UPI00364292AF